MYRAQICRVRRTIIVVCPRCPVHQRKTPPIERVVGRCIGPVDRSLRIASVDETRFLVRSVRIGLRVKETGIVIPSSRNLAAQAKSRSAPNILVDTNLAAGQNRQRAIIFHQRALTPSGPGIRANDALSTRLGLGDPSVEGCWAKRVPIGALPRQPIGTAAQHRSAVQALPDKTPNDRTTPRNTALRRSAQLIANAIGLNDAVTILL